MTKVELVELGKKICLILSRQEKIGNKLHCTYQGGGKALFQKIVVTKGDEKFLKAAKKFLTGELSLSLTQEPHHGKGGKNNTLLVPLFGIKEESLEKINSLSQGIVHTEKIIQHYKTEVEPCEKEVAEQAPSISVVAHKKMSDASKYRLSLSRYLRPIMEMEGVNPNQFPFDKESQGGGIITIRCENEDIARMIERAVSHTSEDSVVVGDSVLIVDCSKFYELKHKPFAFPPKDGQSLAIITEKVKSVCASKLQVTAIPNSKNFIISFSRETALKKAVKIFASLDWFIIEASREDKKMCVKGGLAEWEVPFTPAPVSHTHYASHKPFVSTIPVPSSNNDDIIKELKSISASGNLSPETMERINRVLIDDLKKKNPEEYAKTLLAKLGY